MILSHKHKFIFLCNGKTGTTSIEKALQPFQEGEEYNFYIKGVCPNRHVYPAIIKACLPKDVWNSYYKFTFVRNPWDLFVSSWKYRYSRHLKQLQLSYCLRHPKAAIKVYQKFNYWQLKSLKEREVFSSDDIDFHFNFLKQDFGIPPYSGRYQYHYVYDLDGYKLVDFVGRFENLESDFETIKEKLGINVDLPVLNKTKRSDYRKYFDNSSKQRVEKLWQRDIELFEYSFDGEKK